MSEENTMSEVNNDAGSALRSMMDGGAPVSSVSSEALVKDTPTSNTSTLDSLEIKQDMAPDASPEGSDASKNTPVDTSDFPEIEMKVKGYKDLQKVKLDPNSEEFRSLVNKGLRFEKASQENAKQRKELQEKIEKYQDYEDKAEVAGQVATAKKLMEAGHNDQALSAVLGDGANSFIDAMVEARIGYQNASPEERLQLDLDKQSRQEQLQRQNDADRIAALEAQINARSAKSQEAEFSGYINDAKGRYDLSQWVDDTGAAEDLNDMLHTAAMADIISLQRQREANGKDAVSQRDIRRAYATRAKRLIQHHESQSSKMADQKVEEQANVAKQNAQVASTKNYGQNTNALDEWKKSGGGMSALVDLFNRR